MLQFGVLTQALTRLLQTLAADQIQKKNSPPFKKLEGSLPFSQNFTTATRPESDVFIPHPI